MIQIALEETACFRLAVSDPEIAGGHAKCLGSTTKSNWVDGGGRAGVNPGFVEVPAGGDPVPVTIDLINIGDEDGILNYEVAAFSANGNEDDQIVSLNGRPPGTSVPGVLSASVGETASLTVNVGFESHEPFNFFELRVSADLDNNGDKETVTSTALRSLPPVAVIPTVSHWGLVILALLLLTVCKIYFGRGRALPTAR